MDSADLTRVFEATLAAKDEELAQLQQEVERLQEQRTEQQEQTLAKEATVVAKDDELARLQREVERLQKQRSEEQEQAPDPIGRAVELPQQRLSVSPSVGQRPETRRKTDAMTAQAQAGDSEWTVAAFATSLGVAKAVSAALMDGAPMAMPAGGEFELVQSLAGRAHAIEEKLRVGKLVERVAGMLSEGANQLKSAEAATGAELNEKFAASGGAFKGEMGFGDTKEFYGGVPETTAPAVNPRISLAPAQPAL